MQLVAYAPPTSGRVPAVLAFHGTTMKLVGQEVLQRVTEELQEPGENGRSEFHQANFIMKTPPSNILMVPWMAPPAVWYEFFMNPSWAHCPIHVTTSP